MNQTDEQSSARQRRSASVSSNTPLIEPNRLSFKSEETWMSWITRPRVADSSRTTAILLVVCACVTSTTYGYDSSMMNGLNMLPLYFKYFHLSTATMSLATSSLWVGGALAGLTYGKVTDSIGRRYALFLAAAITTLSVALQSAAQNITTFIVARILVGYGVSASTLTGPTYLAETLPYQWRAWGLGVLNDCYYIGGLVAALVTYNTARIDSTWAWRTPSVVQGIFSIMCICILPFIPESPRWLANLDRRDEALTVLAQTYANGDETDPTVLDQYKEIIATIEFERNVGETLSLMQMVMTPMARKRVSLALSCAVLSVVSGNVIASYYLGTMLENAGVTDTTTQLQINIILNIWCLLCALLGTYYADTLGRKPLALLSTTLLTIFLLITGLLSGFSTPLVYPTITTIFLFMGSYSFGWTPLLYLYPPEVLNYPIRANGMGVFTFVTNVFGLGTVFIYPFAVEKLGWWCYLGNAVWNCVEVGWIAGYWVETAGKTLEEIDACFDRRKIQMPTEDEVETGLPAAVGSEVAWKRGGASTE